MNRRLHLFFLSAAHPLLPSFLLTNCNEGRTRGDKGGVGVGMEAKRGHGEEGSMNTASESTARATLYGYWRCKQGIEFHVYLCIYLSPPLLYPPLPSPSPLVLAVKKSP